ncbi:hypothetical protein Gorai_012190, partial [Gossypium raimondii]|nr:hypothetical protein [Gossypium raimondii]
MVASSRGFTTQLELKLSTLFISYGLAPSKKKRMCFPRDPLTILSRISCCCSEPVVPVRRGSGSGKSNEKVEDWRFDSKKSPHRVRVQASSAMPFASAQSRFPSKQEKFYSRCTPRNSGPQSRDTPPKRDTGIANEKDWGISLLNESVNESGTNEDGST